MMMTYLRRAALRKRYCSFCEKEQALVQRMIVGTFGHICNECVDKFHAEIHDGLQQHRHTAASETKPTKSCEVWMGSSWQCSEPAGHTGDHCFNGVCLPRHHSDKSGIHGYDNHARQEQPSDK